jgi:uncharacterized YigZ family protein
VKGSRFLGQALAAGDDATAQDRLDRIRRRHHDATHHCWALRHGFGDAVVERSDDDGEPAQTAGPPLLGALQRARVTDALVVVTRWFGGTKLGRGGLVRAYGQAAREAVETAPPRILWHDAVLEVSCVFEDLGAVEAVLAQQGPVVRGVERDFRPQPHLLLRLRRSRATAVARALVEATAARVSLRWR